jgi:hypothetical protein
VPYPAYTARKKATTSLSLWDAKGSERKTGALGEASRKPGTSASGAPHWGARSSLYAGSVTAAPIRMWTLAIGSIAAGLY